MPPVCGLSFSSIKLYSVLFCNCITEKSRKTIIRTHHWAASSEWYLSPMRAAKVQASLRIRAVSPEPPLLAHICSESRGTFRQKARSPAPLNGWACAVKICHDGMLEDTKSLDAAHWLAFSQICLGCTVDSAAQLIFASSSISSLRASYGDMSPVKRICVFEHSVMTNLFD